MKIEITSRETLKNIPSASGIELIQQEFWLMSDNSPWLFILNKELEPTNRIMIADTSDLVNGVIPKKDKHDLEGMMSFVYKGDSLLLLFGSGSKWPSRNSAILIDASTKKVRRTFDLTAFYSALMEEAKLEEDDLNIEAATVSRDELFLFNRGKNKLITMKLDRFMEYIFNERNSIKMKVYSVDLPEIDGIPAGFSGAVYNEESQRIYFTASVENTSDWVADGNVLGSIVGELELSNLYNHVTPKCKLLVENGKTALVKVESIAVVSSFQQKIQCVLVTDNDLGESELLRIDF